MLDHINISTQILTNLVGAVVGFTILRDRYNSRRYEWPKRTFRVRREN